MAIDKCPICEGVLYAMEHRLWKVTSIDTPNSGWLYRGDVLAEDYRSGIADVFCENGHTRKQIRKAVPREPVVYFIVSRQLNLVKIGTTTDVDRRIATMQTGSPSRLELLGTILGDAETESYLHIMFAEYRAHGEWFHYSEEIQGYIDHECNRQLEDAAP